MNTISVMYQRIVESPERDTITKIKPVKNLYNLLKTYDFTDTNEIEIMCEFIDKGKAVDKLLNQLDTAHNRFIDLTSFQPDGKQKKLYRYTSSVDDSLISPNGSGLYIRVYPFTPTRFESVIDTLVALNGNSDYRIKTTEARIWKRS